MALIFVVSGTPKDRIPELGFWDDLLKQGAHAVAYAVLQVLWLRALATRLAPGRAGWLALVITVLYALSDEYHQTFVPGRVGTGIDLLTDAAGALAGWWAWRSVGRRIA